MKSNSIKKTSKLKAVAVIKEEKGNLQSSSAETKKVLQMLRKNGVNQSEVMDALLEKGDITEEELANILAKEHGLELIKNLNEYKISKEVLGIIPQKVCMKNTILPLIRIDKTLVVIFSDPLNMSLRDNLNLITGYKIQPVVSTKTAIKEAFRKYYDNRDTMDSLVYNMSSDVVASEEEGIDLDADPGGVNPLISFVNLVFTDAVRLKSSDIHIETYEKDLRIRYRIDGMLHEKHTLSREMASAIVSRIKVMSGMDISEKRKPQDARLKLRLSGVDLNMRVNSMPTVNGEKVVLRILDNSALQVNMSELGMEEFQVTMFKEALSQSQGLILMTGPTGSGKTTTIYSGLIALNTSDRNISTAEDPVEFRIRGINQVQMNPKAGMDFSSSLRAFLRQDPDVILVGEIRDLETAEIAFKASSTGHLVLSTVHTNDTSSTVTRLLAMGIPSYSVADNTSLIISQRLLRCLCTHCRVLASSSFVENLEELGVFKGDIPSYEGKVYETNPEGCNQCNGLGYKGRIAIYEMMKITKAVKEGIFNKSSSLAIKDMAIEKDNLLTLRQNALLKLKQGMISVEEVLRGTVF